MRQRELSRARRAPSWFVAVALALCGLAYSSASVEAAFIRGDVNADGVVEASDAISLLDALYTGGPQPDCWDAADVSDDGTVSIVDPVWILTYLFAGGPQPPAPFPTEGGDPTPDDIFCSVPGVTVTLAADEAITGGTLEVTIDNDNAASVTVSFVQAPASSGTTDATFSGGVSAIVVAGLSTVTTEIEAGSVACTSSTLPVSVTVEGEVAADFVICSVDVQSVAFDHSTDNLGDGVELRQSRFVDVMVPEFVPGVRSHEILYVANQTPDVQVTLEVTPSDFSGTLELSANGGGTFPDLAPTTFSATGAAQPVFLSFAQPTPAAVGEHAVTWGWVATTPSGSAASVLTSDHTIFTVLGVPTAPWTPTPGGGTRQPRVDALEVLVAFAGGATTLQDARVGVVQGGFNIPSFRYDTVSGSPGFGNFSGGSFSFNLDFYITQGFGGTGSVVGCCYDSASIIVCFQNLNGDDLNWLASGSGFVGGSFGYLNTLDPIGTTTPYSNNPFTQNSFYRDDPICAQDGSQFDTDRSLFGNHTFAGVGSGATALIYDLTCTFDVDSNPDTTAVWPEGTTASTGLTADTLTDAGEMWPIDAFAGFLLRADVESTSPNPYPQYDIVSNTADTITTTGSPLTTWASIGNFYEIFDPSVPAVMIEYAVGWDWPTYRDICVDDNPASGTANPITYGFTFP